MPIIALENRQIDDVGLGVGSVGRNGSPTPHPTPVNYYVSVVCKDGAGDVG